MLLNCNINVVLGSNGKKKSKKEEKEKFNVILLEVLFSSCLLPIYRALSAIRSVSHGPQVFLGLRLGV